MKPLAPIVTKNIKHTPLPARSPYILTLKYLNSYYLVQDVQLWTKNYKACQTQQRKKKKKKRTGSVMTQMLVSSHRDLKITTINLLRDLMLKANKTLDNARDGNS